MNLKRIWILIKNEIFHGPKDVVLVMSIVMPVLLALFVNLAFGNIFSERAALGIYDTGDSQLIAMLESSESINLKIYTNEANLMSAVENGSVDMGIVIPADFNDIISSGTVNMQAYVWGEIPSKNLVIIGTVLTDTIYELSGAELPVNIETVALGDESIMPWSDRLLPLVVLMAIFFGGMMIPASSLINEKNRHTLEALNVSPASIGEIFTAKGTVGAILALFMGILTLIISGQLNSSFLSIVLIMALGAVMATEFGLLAGAYIKDMNTLFAFWKFGGLLLFGPAVVYMFPQMPQWIGYIFPTFYVIKPVIDLSVNGLGLGSIITNLTILVIIVIVFALVVSRVVSRLSTRALRLNG
ncbi:MAG: ABC transporter permease [Dehalococcoidales bacterium]|nr:ABC transporter permease [Dehalococcoidales bacterium]